MPIIPITIFTYSTYNRCVLIFERTSTCYELEPKFSGKSKPNGLVPLEPNRRVIGSLRSPPPPKKPHGRFYTLGRLFKPWKWRRRKKSDKFEATSRSKCIPYCRSKVKKWIFLPVRRTSQCFHFLSFYYLVFCNTLIQISNIYKFKVGFKIVRKNVLAQGSL